MNGKCRTNHRPFRCKGLFAGGGARVPDWEAAGFTIQPLRKLLELVVTEENHVDRVIDTSTMDDLVTCLSVRYDGFCAAGDQVATVEIAKQTLTRVRAGDFVFSHINAIHGAGAVVPEEYDGLVVSNDCTVCRPSSDLNASVLGVCANVRSPRQDAHTCNRNRADPSSLGRAKEAAAARTRRGGGSRIDDAVKRANTAEDATRHLRTEASHTASIEMFLDSPRVRSKIAAFKPPR